MQQQAQPKPSPPRRTSQPVTIKPPPPEVPFASEWPRPSPLPAIQSQPLSQTPTTGELTASKLFLFLRMHDSWNLNQNSKWANVITKFHLKSETTMSIFLLDLGCCCFLHVFPLLAKQNVVCGPIKSLLFVGARWEGRRGASVPNTNHQRSRGGGGGACRWPTASMVDYSFFFLFRKKSMWSQLWGLSGATTSCHHVVTGSAPDRGPTGSNPTGGASSLLVQVLQPCFLFFLCWCLSRQPTDNKPFQRFLSCTHTFFMSTFVLSVHYFCLTANSTTQLCKALFFIFHRRSTVDTKESL